MRESKHLFDLLQHWSELSDSELEALYSKESAEAIRAIAAQLTEDTSQHDWETAVGFAASVQHLRRLYVEGSRDLARAIMQAADFLALGKVKDARVVYQRFLEENKSPFYRAVARSHLTDID